MITPIICTNSDRKAPFFRVVMAHIAAFFTGGCPVAFCPVCEHYIYLTGRDFDTSYDRHELN